mgnify:CR=1 FL=1
MSKIRTFFNKYIEVVNDINCVSFSDVEMFHRTNSLLPKGDRISISYFEALKSPNQAGNGKSISNNTKLTDEEKQDFLDALNYGRINSKYNLTQSALENSKEAYSKLWFLERKNTDLQLNQNVNINHQIPPIIQISVGDKETENIINNLIGDGNGKTIDVEHSEITKDDDNNE